MWQRDAFRGATNESSIGSVVDTGMVDSLHPFIDEGERVMRSASLRGSIARSAALMALVLLASNVLAQTVTINVDSPFSPIPVGTGQTVANVSTTNTPPTPPYTCTLSGPTWQWTINNEPDGVTISPNGSTATVNAQNVSSSGEYSITVSAYASWTDSCGGSYPDAAGNDMILDLVVVAVTGITPKSEVYTTKNIGDTLTKADFDITTDPPGYQDEDFVVVAPVTIQLGDNWVTATCGTSSAQTDVIGCMCYGSLSDLIVGPDNSDDSVNFTALVQGTSGTYMITGDSSAAMIDGGDTSGSLAPNEVHSGTVYVSATPPDDSNTSRLLIYPNGSLAYGLGGIPGTTETKQVNGQTQDASGTITNTVTAQAAPGPMVGKKVANNVLALAWWKPTIFPASDTISTSTNANGWQPNSVISDFTMIADGHARSSVFGYHYTLDPQELLVVQDPNKQTVTNPNNQPVIVWTSAQANLAGQPGTSQSNPKKGSSAADSAVGPGSKTQIKTGSGEAKLWVGTITDSSVKKATFLYWTCV
jgi:hypothetical protein